MTQVRKNQATKFLKKKKLNKVRTSRQISSAAPVYMSRFSQSPNFVENNPKKCAPCFFFGGVL